MSTLILTFDTIVFFLPLVLGVAFVTICERKQLAAMQRRVGPNTVGAYGILQPLFLNL